jgi:hypothetical protein
MCGRRGEGRGGTFINANWPCDSTYVPPHLHNSVHPKRNDTHHQVIQVQKNEPQTPKEMLARREWIIIEAINEQHLLISFQYVIRI